MAVGSFHSNNHWRLRRVTTIGVKLRADLVGGNYVWSWTTEIAGDPSRVFRQSTFLGQPRSPGSSRVRARHEIPTLNEDGLVNLAALNMMADGKLTVGEIADALLAGFPERFRDHNAALGRVGDLAVRYHQQTT